MSSFLQVSEAFAVERFEFKLGDKIHILSDKGYRHTQNNSFEAVGNVVITHETKALYGEKATVSLGTGETNVIGNVRYVGPDMTLYGSKIEYNFMTQLIDVYNAKIQADNYSILGKKISKISNNVIVGEDAEYTTCRDCPESWSVLGRYVHVTLGEYVRITHAFIKVKGVIVLYLPYIVLPIKKKRETGLLFPKFGFGLSEGVRFQQPWFWNIKNDRDLTLSPSLWGKRGLGHESEYRQVYGQNRYVELYSLGSFDKVYEEYKQTEERKDSSYFRHFNTFEHLHYYSNNTSQYVYYEHPGDLDIVRDYESYFDQPILASDLGGQVNVNHRENLVGFSIDGQFKKNQLVPSAKAFDHSYVQVLPRVRYGFLPFELLNFDLGGKKQIILGLDGNFTHFKQNHYSENKYIRNAYRVNSNPSAIVDFGQIGPLHFKVKNDFTHQYYKFPYEKTDKDFFIKYGTNHESELSLEFYKLFGIAYREEIPLELLGKEFLEKNSRKDEFGKNIIGDFSKFSGKLSKDTHELVYNSYRHNSELKLKHYYISNQQFKGSPKFLNQIQDETGKPRSEGLFDSTDSIKGRENELNYLESRTSIPTSNTVEFQWNNYLIRKQPKKFSPFEDNRYLSNNFEYSQVGYFTVSQGYDLNIASEELVDRLTRLALTGGITFPQLSLRASEYYYHRNGEQITTLGLSKNFRFVDFSLDYVYDSFTTPINKNAVASVGVRPLSTLKIESSYHYDIDRKMETLSRYAFIYTPTNNCWIFDVSYEKSEIQKRISFNFAINFNENNFQSISKM